MIAPSIIAHGFNGIILGITVIFACVYYKNIQNFDTYQMLLVLLLFSITVGVHGLSHVLLEKTYNYVPFNLWKINRHVFN